MNETWETEKMRGMRRKRKKCPYHEEKRSTIMMNIGRNRGLKGGINHNKKTQKVSMKNEEGFNEKYREEEKRNTGKRRKKKTRKMRRRRQGR